MGQSAKLERQSLSQQANLTFLTFMAPKINELFTSRAMPFFHNLLYASLPYIVNLYLHKSTFFFTY